MNSSSASRSTLHLIGKHTIRDDNPQWLSSPTFQLLCQDLAPKVYGSLEGLVDRVLNPINPIKITCKRTRKVYDVFAVCISTRLQKKKKVSWMKGIFGNSRDYHNLAKRYFPPDVAWEQNLYVCSIDWDRYSRLHRILFKSHVQRS